MVPLNEYEARQADEIAAWKSERPSLVMAAFRGLTRPVSRLASKVVPHEAVRRLVDDAEKATERWAGADKVARAAGVGDIVDLRRCPLQKCDELAASITTPAERQAMVEATLAGLGGVVTETLNAPVLLTLAIRSIDRIGHCYGYRLDAPTDRILVLCILELAAADDWGRREALFRQIRRLTGATGRSPSSNGAPRLEGFEASVIEDAALGAVPVVGDVAAIVLDYEFIHRVDVAARRVFQERWLHDQKKVEQIFPAPAGRRRSSIQGGVDLVAQFLYVGSYGLAFGVTLPVALAARLASGGESPVARGLCQGAADALDNADRLLSRAGTDRPTKTAKYAKGPRALTVHPAA